MQLKDLTLAPYIQKAMALRNKRRKVGGNIYRHSMAVMFILMDYYHKDWETNPVMLKAAILHDLVEEFQDYDLDELRQLDADGPAVLEIVLILTQRKGESKEAYLQRVLESGNETAYKIKVADRISNLTDMHIGMASKDWMKRQIDFTEKYIVPMAEIVNKDMVKEVKDLIRRRRSEYLRTIDQRFISSFLEFTRITKTDKKK